MGTPNNQTARLASPELPAPDPEWVRGNCPRCGQDLVSRCYYVAGRGYLVAWECWGAREGSQECDYRRIL